MNTSESLRDDIYIVAFTKDWNDVPTCTTHILRDMARTIPVLWVCSIGTRKPQARSGKDWRRLAGRVLSGLRRAEWKENRLSVLRPVLVPKAESRLTRWFNRRIFRWYLKRELPRSFRGSVEFWCFVPNAVDFIPETGGGAPLAPGLGHKVVYYCADDWTKFHNLDGAWMEEKERRLIQHADVVFATSRYLAAKLQGVDAKAAVVYMPHGVDFTHFARACDKRIPLPDDIATLPHPMVGFYGNLHPWVDFSLIAALAKARPRWTFALIGEVYSDVGTLRETPNVHLLGRREHAILPDYCRGFDAAMIPYDMSNPRMESVNPVKTKELLAAGVPVVSSRVPELEGYGDRVLPCTSVDEWLQALERQVSRTPDERRLISESVRDEDWSCKVRQIRNHLEIFPPQSQPPGSGRKRMGDFLGNR